MGCGCNKNKNRKNMKSSRMPAKPRNSLRVPVRKDRLKKLTENDGTPNSIRSSNIKLKNALERQKRTRNIKTTKNNKKEMQRFWKTLGKTFNKEKPQ